MGIGAFNRSVERFTYGALTLLGFGFGGGLWWLIAFTDRFEAPATKPILACAIFMAVGFVALRKLTGLDRISRRRKIYGAAVNRPITPNDQLYPHLPAVPHEPVRFRHRISK